MLYTVDSACSLWSAQSTWLRIIFSNSFLICSGFVPICSLGLSQIGRMNFGRDASTFKYYTMCGLQEGFEPFAVNMNRDVAMWFSKRLPTFVNVPKTHPYIEVKVHRKKIHYIRHRHMK